MADVTVKIQQMKVGETIASSPDELRINVQPSTTVKWGVFLSCNAHRESFGKVKGKGNAAGAAEVIGVEWEKMWHRAESIFDGILTKATAG